ncbi:hypothetical protein GCM10010954_21600 [Halobacillus andaensis]|uniref:DUF4871 domain-containing protein n=1 Tax=Halobacillus andaensis TaxID=1176239 RepID=A0A917B540_HALAA|nr:hypothetical protein [Halobacillus andaensis]MBP2004331.1 hypothetical protein [Halobacillus andaensis]GGF22476.1 hypothetical protein GCM10010954_21600 [Halobacillus andaensis]
MRKLYPLLVVLLVWLTGCSEEEWKESERFESGSYQMIGEKDHVGFIYDGSEVTKFYPDKIQKYMWHFWGEEEELEGDLKVVGIHESGDEVNVLDEVPVAVKEHNGADASVPSTMSLPDSGMWKLNAYINDSLHGSVYIEVQEGENEQP